MLPVPPGTPVAPLSHEPPRRFPRPRHARDTPAADAELERRLRTRRLLETLPGYGTGCEVVGEAGSGEEALTLCRSLRPDLVVLEAGLCRPGESPIELCRDVKSFAPAPVVVLYGDDPQGGSAGLHRAFSGAEAFVDCGGPDAPEKLLEAVARILSGAGVGHATR